MSDNSVIVEGLGYGVGQTTWHEIGLTELGEAFMEIAFKEFERDSRLMCIKFMYDDRMIGYVTRTELGL